MVTISYHCPQDTEHMVTDRRHDCSNRPRVRPERVELWAAGLSRVTHRLMSQAGHRVGYTVSLFLAATNITKETCQVFSGWLTRHQYPTSWLLFQLFFLGDGGRISCFDIISHLQKKR